MLRTSPGLKNRLALGLLFTLFFAANHSVFGQQKYWIVLKDKAGVTFDPYMYFDQKAIDRRLRQNLPLADETDKPINQTYFRQIENAVDSVTGSSRWLNAMACFTSQNQIETLRKFSFVKDIIPVYTNPVVFAQAAKTKNATTGDGSTGAATSYTFKTDLDDEEQKLLSDQLTIFGASEFKKLKLDGSGLRIAVFDAGFTSVDKNPAFDHIRQGNKIIRTWDFVKSKEFVYDYASHGTMVLSCIGGRIEGKDIGLATGAEFLLARTEKMRSEPYSEEENWLEALEWADKNGADIINSSLGYTHHRYFREDMNGQRALVTRAANLAARKGMLVVNSNGNEGAGDWKILGAPADADSVLAVGGINPESLIHINFSSYGPTADKRMKPNVTAFGEVIAAAPDKLEGTQGTSFSSPLVAGFAACAWQSNLKLTTMELFKEIEKAGNLYPYYDYAHGFGVPQAQHFLSGKPETQPTIGFKRTGNQLQVFANSDFFIDAQPIKKASYRPTLQAANHLTEESNPESKKENALMYYHFANESGVIEKYFVVEVTQPDVLSINLEELPKGTNIKVHYKGYTGTYTY